MIVRLLKGKRNSFRFFGSADPLAPLPEALIGANSIQKLSVQQSSASQYLALCSAR
jgi:hypothetical protein